MEVVSPKRHRAAIDTAHGTCTLRDTDMFSKGPARPLRSLVALIVVITVVPLATLLWLGWRLLEQDRVLERQQIQQRVERGADLVVAGLQRVIAPRSSAWRVAAKSGRTEPLWSRIAIRPSKPSLASA